jgi:hypothetical protein
MPKIKITTDRQPWLDGQPQEIGAICDASDDEASVLVSAGFAELLDEPAKRARRVKEEAL